VIDPEEKFGIVERFCPGECFILSFLKLDREEEKWIMRFMLILTTLMVLCSIVGAVLVLPGTRR
jgi:hypothetical protein